jgi:AcrR family transcriptional regulator
MWTSGDHEPALPPARERILAAAFEAFTTKGYDRTSTLDIARRAKISKRDLYANFGSKHAMLVACITNRAERMRLPPDLPSPRDRRQLAVTLATFGGNLVREVSRPPVIAAFRLAIAEASRSPEIAQAVEAVGRGSVRERLVRLLASAQSGGLLGPGDPMELAEQYLGLLWEGLLVGLLMGIAQAPAPAGAELRAEKATTAFMRLHPTSTRSD